MLDLFDEPCSETDGSLYANQYPMRPHPCGKGHIITVPDGELYYAPDFFEPRISDRAMDVLLANDRYPWQSTNWQEITDFSEIKWTNIAWQQSMIQMYGRELALPRLSAWHGDNDQTYTYSRIRLHPAPWNQILDWLRGQLTDVSGVHFNSVLLNWYRNGDDHISWHTDAEPELGRNPSIASINFGATRRFILRRSDDHQQKIELPLKHGSLLIMSGALQHHWQHSVPKEKAVKASRVNLTFRVIKSIG